MVTVKFDIEEIGWLLKKVLDRINKVNDNPEYPEADKLLLDFLGGMREKLYKLMGEQSNGSKDYMESCT